MIEKSIAIYTIIDDLLGEIEHSEPKNRKVSDSEIITTAVISALYFSGNQEKGICFMKSTKLIPGMLSKSRFNRRLHMIRNLIVELFFQLSDMIKKLNIKSEYITSGLKHLQKKDFRNWLLNFPDDTNEEERIVQLLSTLDRAIASTEQLIAKYQRIKTGLLHDLLTRGIDEHGDLRSEKTHKFKDSKLGRIPVEWECKPLGEIYTDLKSGSTPLRKNKAYFENGTFLWVKTLDLNEDDIFDTQEKITKRAIEESSCNLFPVNSVLIAMYGGWEQIGRTAVLKKEATTNQAITALFNPRIGIVAEYIQFFLQHFRYKWKSYAVSTRKDPNITKTDIQNYLIAFPKEDAEQQNIVKAIKNSKRTISNYNDYLTKLQSLKTGLMQDLLSGKVRIKI